MRKRILILLLSIWSLAVSAQLVNVQADYDALGDCYFSAYNNTKVPLFLNVKLADLENTVFTEPRAYLKKLDPGFTSLFTLQRDPDADVPRFTYEIKVFRSNPLAKVNLEFPYLLPFAEGKEVSVFEVTELDHFWGQEEPESWYATGFYAESGEEVFACRSGIVVEVVGNERTDEAKNWYNNWTNVITVLQEDGTLLCYRNVEDSNKKLKIGEKIYAGQLIGKVSRGANSLIVVIVHESLFVDSPRFIIPHFVSKGNESEILSFRQTYEVIHPNEIVGLEMSSKEKRKMLGKKK